MPISKTISEYKKRKKSVQRHRTLLGPSASEMSMVSFKRSTKWMQHLKNKTQSREKMLVGVPSSAHGCEKETRNR